MVPTAVIAALTVKEAVRRRFVFAGFLISLAFIVLAFIPIHSRGMMFIPPELVPQLIKEILATRGCSMIAFFSLLFAVSLGAGTISGEIERGMLSVIVPKPVRRVSIYFGKWLGINLFIAPFVLFWLAVLQYAIVRHTQHSDPALWRVFWVLLLYPAAFSALTMLFSSVTSTLLSTILPLILAATAWSEGIIKAFGYGFDIAALKTIGKGIVYLAPLNPLSRLVEKVLKPSLLMLLPSHWDTGPPDPPAGLRDVAWVIVYAAIALIVGAIVFQRRDIGT